MIRKFHLGFLLAIAAFGAFADDFVVGVTLLECPPYTVYTADGNFGGIEIDIVRNAAERLGRELVLKPMIFTQVLPALQRGEIEAAIAQITVTDARKRNFDFSKSYAQDGSVFLYRRGTPVPTMITAGTMKLGTVDGTCADIYLCRHGFNPTRFSRGDDGLAAMKEGRIEAFFYDRPSLANFVKLNPEFAITPLETRGRYAVAVAKGKTNILDAVNDAIDEVLGTNRTEERR